MKATIHFCIFIFCVLPSILFGNSPKDQLAYADFTSNITSGCPSLSVNFADASNDPLPDTIISYTWYFGDGNISSLQNPTHIYNTAGLYSVRLVVTSQSGWKDSVTRMNYINVTAPPASQLGGDTTFCFGNSITLDAGNPGATYLWNTGDMSQQIDIFWAGEYTVAITNNGCTSYDTILAYTNAPLYANFAFQQEPGCLPTMVSFIDLSQTCQGSIVEWNWDFGDGATSTQQNPQHTYSENGTYLAQLTIKDNFGGITNVQQEVIINSAVPNVSLGADTSICNGSSLLLKSGVADASYLWNTGETSPDILATNPGTYWVVVSNNGTCSSSDTIIISTATPATPQFTYQVQQGCAPVDVQFTDQSTSCAGITINQWLWEFGDGNTSTLQNPLANYTAAGIYNVKLTVTTMDGFITSKTQPITVVVSSPLVQLGNDTAFCEGSNLQLNAGVSGATYTWNTGETTQSIAVNLPGKYWVAVTKNNCVSSDTIRVFMNPALTPAFGYTYQTLCLPIVVKFTDSSKVCGTSINSWKWDFGDGILSTQQHPTHNYLTNGTYIVRLTITSTDGSIITKSKNVIVSSAKFTSNLGNDTTICYGNTLRLDGGNPGSMYLWNTGEASKTIEVTDPGNYWVRVEKSGCVAFDTINVKNTFPVTANFGYRITSKCLPVIVQFTDSSLVRCGGAISEWHWDFGDGKTSIQQHPTHSYTRSDSFNVRLIITAANGVIISKTKRLYIENVIPSVNLGTDLTICKGSVVQLEAGVDNAVYLWNPQTAINNDTIRNPIVNPGFTTTYTVTVTKCMVTVKDDIIIHVDSLRRPVITQDGNTLKSTPSEFYQWYRDQQVIQGATTRSYRAKQMGQYSVKIRNSRGCENESLPHLFIPRNNNGTELNGISINISPNPTPGLINILLDVKPEKPVSVTVIDRYGKRMLQTKIDQQVNYLRMNALAKGHYFIELKMDNKLVVIPVVVQ